MMVIWIIAPILLVIVVVMPWTSMQLALLTSTFRAQLISSLELKCASV